MTNYNNMEFVIETPHGQREEKISVSSLIAAGWVGRNKKDLEDHIQEMQLLGIKRPTVMPVFNRVAISRLTQNKTIEVLGKHSSGEVEFVLIKTESEILIGVGSDHTDNRIEAFCMAAAKQVYDKSIAPVLWRYSDVHEHWDQLILRSFITVNGERQLYQESSVDVLLHPEKLISFYDNGSTKFQIGTAIYGGTFSSIGGVQPSTHFDYELEDPVLKRKIHYDYSIEELPIAEEEKSMSLVRN